MNRKRSRGCGATTRGSGLLGRAAQEMAAGGCMQHGRWVEAGKRVEARLQKADSGRGVGSSAGGAMNRKQRAGGRDDDAGSGMLGRAARKMAAGACMQQGRRAEAGKRVQARLQRAD